MKNGCPHIVWLVLLLGCSQPDSQSPAGQTTDTKAPAEVSDAGLSDVPPPDTVTSPQDTNALFDSTVDTTDDTNTDSMGPTDIEETDSSEPRDSAASSDTQPPPTDTREDTLDGPETQGDTAPPTETQDDGLTPPSDTVSDVVAEDTSTADSDTSLCLPEPPVENVPEDFPLHLGKKLGADFIPLETGDPIEIVQGPQGGVHLELTFKITLPESFSESKALVLIDAKTIQPCCTESQSEVATFYSAKYPLYPKPGAMHTYYSDVIPIIFEQNQAVHYEDQDCCVRFQVSVYAPGTQDILWTSWTEDSLFCTDSY